MQSDQFFIDKAKAFIQNGVQVNDIENLKSILHWADKKYYTEDISLLTDQEYDQLFTQLKNIEAAHPNLVSADSPTQRVAFGISNKLQTKQHGVPMLSLDNTYNTEDLLAWNQRVHNALPNTSVQYSVEPKYDGASISILFENGILQQALTRGDGLQGEDVTANIRLIKSLPLKINNPHPPDSMELRGEVIFNKKTFDTLNAERAEEGLPILANPRNAASGTLRILDLKEAAKRKLSIVLYQMADVHATHFPEAFQSHHGTIQWMTDAGLPTPLHEMKLFANINDVVQYCHDFEQKRDALPYEIDGMVIKVDALALQDQLGMTTHHPRWAVAYKFKARQAKSKLLRVEFQVGRTGAIAPVAKLEPVAIGGVTVSSVTLFNEDIIKEKDVRLGDTLLIERAGDVIPYIVGPIKELRTGTEQPIIFPVTCPVCNEALEKPEEEAVWRCININCPAQVVERIIHFCSKDAMDIRGLGGALVNKFYEQKIVQDIPGLYHLPFEKLSSWEGFGKKSMENLAQAIEQSKLQPLHRLIFGLGIRHVGETMSKTLARAITNLKDLYHFNEAELLALEDVGPKVAHSILHFFEQEGNRNLIDRLESAGVKITNDQKQNMQGEGALTGKTFLFTGTLHQLKRSEAEAKVEAIGGKILSAVSSKLNYLIVGEDAGSKLEKAKKLSTITILTEAEFIQMIEG